MSHTLQTLLQTKDHRALHEHLKHHHLSPESLKLFLQDDSLRYLGLLYLQEHAPKITERSLLEKYTALLPRALPERSEEQVILAELYLRLWPWNREAFFPRWREAALPPIVRIAWCRAEILIDPATLSVWGEDEVLLQAMRALAPADILYPKEHLAELLRSPLLALQLEALKLLPALLRLCALLPLEAQALLLLALQSSHAHPRELAFELLSQPWARVLGCPEGLLRALLAEGASPSQVRCAASWSLAEPLIRVFSDEAAALSSRREALSLLGELIEREQLTPLLRAAASAPAIFGEPCLDLLTGAHRRGVFLQDEHVADLLSLFFHHERLPAEKLARLSFTSRREVFAQLSALAPDSPHWRRAAPLLVALALGPQGRQRLPVVPLLIEKLNAASRRTVFLQALAQVADESAEAALLPLLTEEPSLLLPILRKIGGAATKEKLCALGLSAGEPHPALLTEYSQALALLWHLSSFEEKQALLPRLEPTQLSSELRAGLAGFVLPSARRVLLHQVAEATTLRYLIQVARFGDEEDWPSLLDLALRLTTEIAAGECLNLKEQGEEQQTFPEEVIEALQSYGSRLRAAGRIRPAFLLDMGHQTVAALCLQLLQREDLSLGETSVLLRALRPWTAPAIFPGVYHLLREDDPQLRKLVLFLLAKDGAEILSVNLARLTEAEDIQTVRQALNALGESKASWAVQSIARCLEHKNMNIKKAAAEALVEAATPDAVPAMLAWLSRQDNPGLRSSMLAALKRVLQDAYVPTVIAAAQGTDEPRRQGLLLSALSGTLSPALVQRIAQREHPISLLLLERLQRGSLSLSTGSLGDLALALERFGLSLETAVKAPPALSEEVRALQELGWSPGLAAKIAQQPRWSTSELAALRRFLPEWLQLAQTSPPPLQAQALSLCVALEPSSPQELAVLARRVEVLLLGLSHQGASYQDKCLRLLEAVCPNLSQGEALWVASLLRELPGFPARSNHSFLSLLKLCGAVWTRRDVSLALSRCLLGHDHRAETIRVLAEAFGPYAKKLVPEPLREYLSSCAAAGRLPERLRCESLLPSEPPSARSRALLSGLFESFAEATKPMQEMLLDWCEQHQPIGAPAWILHERARDPEPSRERRDATMSEAHKDSLLALLLTEKTAKEAAEQLAAWPDQALDVPIFEAYLKGWCSYVPVWPRLLHVLESLPLAEINDLCQTPQTAERVLALFQYSSAELKHACLPLLLSLWQHEAREVSAKAQEALRGISSEVLLNFIWGDVLRGEWQLLSLLRGPVLDTAARRQLLAKYQQHPSVAAWLRLTPAPLRAAPSDREGALSHLQERRLLPVAKRATREELSEVARGKDEEAARKALTALSAQPDEAFVALLVSSLDSASTRVRLHAHRLLRSFASKEVYLEASQRLLDDPLMDVQRSAIRTVMFGRYLPAIPKVVSLLQHPHQSIQLAARDGLLFNGQNALPALKKALKDARPDKRAAFQRVIFNIEAQEERAERSPRNS